MTNTNKLRLIVVGAIAAFIGLQQYGILRLGGTAAGNDQVFADAFANHGSNLQAEGQGTVIRILADDNDGSRHQRFILQLGSGQTLLVAHNADLAPPIAGLSVGDTVAFNGVYEWNAQGGVIHWTHRDPQGVHVAGWIKHGGSTYQ